MPEKTKKMTAAQFGKVVVGQAKLAIERTRKSLDAADLTQAAKELKYAKSVVDASLKVLATSRRGRGGRGDEGLKLKEGPFYYERCNLSLPRPRGGKGTTPIR